MSAHEHVTPLFEQLSRWREQVNERMVEAAFAAFYDYLTRSEHFRQYFESDEQVRRLIQAQKASFLKALTLSPQAFREHYVALGREHACMGIALEDMIAGLQIIRDQLLHYKVLDVRLTYQFIDHIQQHLAEGYFIYEVQQYLDNIRQAEQGVCQLIGDDRMAVRLVQPLRWFIDVVRCWAESEQAGQCRIGDVDSCSITDLIDQLEMDEIQRKQLHQLHHEQHALAQSLDFFLREKSYLLVTFMLSRLYAVTMAMFNTLMAAESQQQMDRLKRDALTGLLLRHELDGLMRQLRRQCLEKGRLGVLMLDVDHFKRVNDRYGHQAGDAVLREVAERLRQVLRDDDCAVRYGGEEFLVLLPCLDKTALERVAERIRHAMAARPVALPDGASLAVTVSVGGVAVEGRQMQSPHKMWIEQADCNLYAAKRAGRNRVAVSRFAPAHTADGR